MTRARLWFLMLGLWAATPAAGQKGGDAAAAAVDSRAIPVDIRSAYEEIDRRVAAYSAKDDVGLVSYLDSVFLHLDLPAPKRLALQLRQCVALRESRDLDRAISAGHDLLARARASGKVEFQSSAIANLAYCYHYAGLYKKSEYWNARSIAFARKHGLTDQLARALGSEGYRRVGENDYAGARDAFRQIVALHADAPLSYGYASAKGGILNAYIYEGDLTSPPVLELLAEVIALSENPELFTTAHARRDLLGILCNYYHEAGEHERAVHYARAHLAHVRKFSSDTSEIVRFALKELFPVEADAGEYAAAFRTLSRLREVEGALLERNQIDQLAEASAKLDVHDHEVARLAAERTAKLEARAKNDRTRLLVIISLLAILILAGTLYAYRRVYRDRQLIERQKSVVLQSLAEKEVLLREIHHRVKNNLQIISSLLQKQAFLAKDENAQKMAREGQERIRSMALIHENLYQSEQLSGVNIQSYLADLGANIARSHATPGKTVDLKLDVEDLHLDLDTAIPVGLILNELLTNAYKYAFPQKDSGTIQVVFRQSGEQFNLEVNDDGVGLPADHAQRRKTSLGHNLVAGLVRQLEGTIEWLGGKPSGTAVNITFGP